MARCSICQTLIRNDDEATACPECTQDYHRSCWDELGGCATYACGEAAPAEKPLPPASPKTGWGDVKTCPVCKRAIASSLLHCGCGAEFPYADPMSLRAYRGWQEKERKRSGGRMALFWLFLVSLLGLPSPVTGAIAGVVAWRNRRRLAGSGGIYLAMGYGAAALGAVYTLFLLLLLIGL